ncbi:phage tail protein [Aureibacter tunicatorum]|uniref:Pyruvate/2-oxoglutarate dehydrogenase complex dihydrolipoamide acyltransferase (E2) component n=1 Tax=Aureibacter tunicatorum TaxID=866807 RepID=A0AAE4BSJ2_9BACT|nr:tail fiber protein [Aureibacter tunicatorum]MDR6238900.1 pyruvate/2-oxoglutarate dehydrogenase complex dihydrolipoamide acyltransferase (E2) component [Aureibacter tunicatorum]BDD05173.1 hypothetical protein AUTU_26560 [Aureibacter tunicatorum]
MFDKLFNSSKEKTNDKPITRDQNATVIRMPQLSETMEYGTIAKWNFNEGDYINSGDTLADIDTEKATIELESYEDGIILYQTEKIGKIAVNEIIAIIGNEGENIEHLLEENDSTINETPSQDSVDELDSIIGEIKMFAGEKIPKNWIKCDGSTFRKEDKKELFSVIGYKFGGYRDQFQVPHLESQNGIEHIIREK